MPLFANGINSAAQFPFLTPTAEAYKGNATMANPCTAIFSRIPICFGESSSTWAFYTSEIKLARKLRMLVAAKLRDRRVRSDVRLFNFVQHRAQCSGKFVARNMALAELDSQLVRAAIAFKIKYKRLRTRAQFAFFAALASRFVARQSALHDARNRFDHFLFVRLTRHLQQQ